MSLRLRVGVAPTLGPQPGAAAALAGAQIVGVDVLVWESRAYDMDGNLAWPIVVGENEFLICQAMWQPDEAAQTSFWLSIDGYATGSQAQPYTTVTGGDRIFQQEYLVNDDEEGSVEALTPGAQYLYWDGGSRASEFTGWCWHMRIVGDGPFLRDLLPWRPSFAVPAFAYVNGQIGSDWYQFLTTAGGTSDSSEPDWSTAPSPSDTLTDGTVTWINNGFYAPV